MWSAAHRGHNMALDGQLGIETSYSTQMTTGYRGRTISGYRMH